MAITKEEMQLYNKLYANSRWKRPSTSICRCTYNIPYISVSSHACIKTHLQNTYAYLREQAAVQPLLYYNVPSDHE